MSKEKRAKVIYHDYNTIDDKPQPLNTPELRERLKSLASYCWGLSISLQNGVEDKTQTAEIERLSVELDKTQRKLEDVSEELDLVRIRLSKYEKKFGVDALKQVPRADYSKMTDKQIADRKRELQKVASAKYFAKKKAEKKQNAEE